MSLPNFTVLVNSCDAFSDCWDPFFRLFATFWPDCPAPVVLNTDRASFSAGDVDLTSSRVARRDPEGSVPTWAERTIRCLDEIGTDQILYLQEDYFFNRRVRDEQVARFSEHLRTSGAACLRLFESHLSGPWVQTIDENVWQVSAASPYLVQLQAALWDRRSLRQILRPHESPWDFEMLGSRRARRRGTAMLCVNRDRFMAPDHQVVPYEPTGIVKGRWVRERVVNLFAEHEIEVDFSVRGFHEELSLGHRSVVSKVADRARRVPPAIRSFR